MNLLRSQEQEEVNAEGSMPWTLSLRSRVKSAELKRGIDISGDQGTYGLGASILHESGWNGSVSTIVGLQTKSTLSTSFGIGYEYNVSDAFSLSIDYTSTNYPNDSVNAVATLNNVVSLGASYDFDFLDVSLSFDRFMGTTAAMYGGVSLSTTFDFDALTIIPSFDISFVSQSIDVSRISIQKGKRPPQLASTTQTIAGLSGISLDALVLYSFGGGFSVSTNPMLTYSAQSDLAARTFTFSVTLGIKYSLGF
jgi:hypothetical protein